MRDRIRYAVPTNAYRAASVLIGEHNWQEYIQRVGEEGLKKYWVVLKDHLVFPPGNEQDCPLALSGQFNHNERRRDVSVPSQPKDSVFEVDNSDPERICVRPGSMAIDGKSTPVEVLAEFHRAYRTEAQNVMDTANWCQLTVKLLKFSGLWNGGQQNDVSEFFQRFFESLGESSPLSSSGRKSINDMFSLNHVTTIVCTCEHRSGNGTQEFQDTTLRPNKLMMVVQNANMLQERESKVPSSFLRMSEKLDDYDCVLGLALNFEAQQEIYQRRLSAKDFQATKVDVVNRKPSSVFLMVLVTMYSDTANVSSASDTYLAEVLEKFDFDGAKYTCRAAIFRSGKLVVSKQKAYNSLATNHGHYFARVKVKESEGSFTWHEADDHRVQTVGGKWDETDDKKRPMLLLYASDEVGYPTHLIGLKNMIGNQCYLNACMQMMRVICDHVYK